MRILSVDDNQENLYLIEATARDHGHEVVSARNGVEALKELANGSFDLIVSDVLMPAMDGFQLCRTVKNDERWKRIPFVFYTATYTAKQDEELGLALGASRFIVRPIEAERFLTMVEEVVQGGESGRIPVPSLDLDDEGRSLSVYNERLVRQLAQKIQQLEATRTELAASIEEKNREIAQRRLAEDALAHSEEQLRLTWDSSTSGMVLTDPQGIVLRANPALARMFARPLDSLPGKPFTYCYAAGEAEYAQAASSEPVEPHAMGEHFETMLRRWDGEEIWIEGSRTMMRTAGQVARMRPTIRSTSSLLPAAASRSAVRNRAQSKCSPAKIYSGK